MITTGYCLGIDYGTSNTAAVIHEPGGVARPLLFDGFPQLPSSVCVGPDGRGLLVGREAIHAARVRPERFEPHPKRRIDDGTVLLGDREYPVEHLIAAGLAQARAEAVRTMGAPPAAVALTYPAAWASRRRAVLVEAARLAELHVPALVPEPVAAAAYFVQGTGADVPAASCVVVYDFGAGTFDASVVRRTDGGWEVAASDGLPDAGGLDVDAAIVAYLGAVYSATHPEQLRRLDRPESPADRRASRNLWEDVRTAKEILSRSSATYVHLPILEQDAPLGREQVERLAGPVVERTVALTRTVIAASVPPGRLAGLFLVGGSSRMPLVATLLHRVTGIAPTVMEQPELAVAYGSVVSLTAPSRPVRQRAPVREHATVLGADPVSEHTAAIAARTVPADPLPPLPVETSLPVSPQAPGDARRAVGAGPSADAGQLVEAAPVVGATTGDRIQTASAGGHGVNGGDATAGPTGRAGTGGGAAAAVGPTGREDPGDWAVTVGVAGQRGADGGNAEAGPAGQEDSSDGAAAMGLAGQEDGYDGAAVVGVAAQRRASGRNAGAGPAGHRAANGGETGLKPGGSGGASGDGSQVTPADRDGAAGSTADRAQGSRRSLFAAVLLLAVLVAMVGLARSTVIAWEFWVGDALLYPGFLLWLAYVFAAPRGRTWWRLAVYALVLVPGCLGAYLGTAAMAKRVGTGVLFWALAGTAAVMAAALTVRRRTDGTELRSVFGRADIAGLVLGLAAFGFVHAPALAIVVTWRDAVAGVPVAVAFAGAGAALGRYVAVREPGARRWLPRAAAILITLGGAATAVRMAAELFG
ncbi:Hsp70 family protein [Dactylosporangium sp. CA-092794]|uniref:Hsp70 family protein n=1 Tax=Dactylosporangium sp. CA-092794 TaxID=3239929 RepID=UPI003D93735D